ncbi:MAG: colicin M resistance protein CbrA, partial [Peptococcaceae bacterium]|nr:colicin M resistance protein CbrA [Peptococcaceae bacterium]
EGISYALNSAYQLAAIINSRCKNPQRAYRRKTFPMRVKLCSKRLKSPFMYQPFLRKWVMKSGVRAISVVAEERRGEV